MSCKNFRLVLVLLLAAFACISVSGCGGGSGGSFHNDNDDESTSVNGTVIIDNELKENELPIILEFEEVPEKSYAMNSLISGEVISVPSRSYLKGLKGVRNPDSFIVNLTRGTEYTVEISKGDYYQYEIGFNVPDIAIINPKGDELDFLDLGESLDVSARHSLSDDVIEQSVYPEENPYMICLTFKPSVTGPYTIELCQSLSDDVIEDDVTLFVYQELRNDDDNSAGYYRRYKFSDKEGNLSSTVKMSDVMAIRQAWNDAAENVIETWEIISDDETENDEVLKKVITETSAVQAYLDCVSRIKQYYGIFDDYKESDDYHEINSYESALYSASDYDDEAITAASGTKGTKIPAEIYGIPYDNNDKRVGDFGFYAITGGRSRYYGIRGGNIKLPVPRNNSVKALYKAGFISSQQDAEKFNVSTSDKAVQLGGFGFDAGYLNTSAFKFGLTSTTFVIHYEKTEARYRMLDDDEDYSLTSEARRRLNEMGSAFFRYVYGDYFVGGHQYGAVYDATITITTNTTEQLDRVKLRLLELFDSEENAEKSDVANKAKEFLNENEATISIEIKTAGVNMATVNSSDFGSIAKSLAEFREKSSKLSSGNMSPVYVMLKRFRLLPPVFQKMREEGDRGLVPISSEHSQKVMNFRRDLVTMHSYYNVIRDTDNMAQDFKNAYRRRYEKILYTIDPPEKSQSYYIFNEENAAKMNALHDDILKLNSDLKNMADRHAFYQLLMEAQTKESNPSSSVLERPYGANGGSIGYKTFMSSKAVQSDIEAGRDFKDEKNTFIGSEWEPKFDAGDNGIFCYIKVTANNVNDRERKAIPPNIGHRTADFFFKCGASRWLEWTVELRSMRFNSRLYPFSGLK
ncbi:MAG: hypothetical protein IJT58_00195 [Synergistaceae bacterium]|nr:hypothetical protein [Synergistaceae bacterium]